MTLSRKYRSSRNVPSATARVRSLFVAGPEIAHLVEQQGATVSQLEASNPAIRGSSECPALVTEHLALHEITRNRGAIHANERTILSRPAAVDGGRHELLSRSGLAGDEHARVGGCDLGDHLANAAKPRAVPDHFGREAKIGAQGSRFALGLSQLQRRREREEDALWRQRFLEKGEGAQLRGANGVAQTGTTAHHHDRHVGHTLTERRENTHAVELSRHHQVNEGEVGLGLDRERDTACSVRSLADLVPLGGQ
jgi:hypothetical protein